MPELVRKRPLVDSVIPTTLWKQVKLKHWFTDEMLHLIRTKRCLYRKMKCINSDVVKMKCINSDVVKMKYTRLLVHSKMRQDTTVYISCLSIPYFANTKKFWNFVNSVKHYCQPPPPLNHLIDSSLMTLRKPLFSMSTLT